MERPARGITYTIRRRITKRKRNKSAVQDTSDDVVQDVIRSSGVQNNSTRNKLYFKSFLIHNIFFMSDINLEAAQILVKGANSKGGLGWLEYYPSHKVYHPGIDLNKDYGNSDMGLPVLCPMDGIVEYVSEDKYNGGFGLHCVIYHAKKNVYTHYVHLARCLVNVSDTVQKGNVIANVGNSGTIYAHLHFEIWTQKLYDEYQKNRPWYKKDYEFYPSGWEKHKVQEYYVNPNEFLLECLGGEIPIPDWLVEKPYPPKEKNFTPPNWKGLDKAIKWNNNLKYKIISNIDSEQNCREVLMFYRNFLNITNKK